MTVKIKRGKDFMVIEVDHVEIVDINGIAQSISKGTLVYESPDTLLWYDGENASIKERRNIYCVNFPIKDFNV